MLTKKTKSKRFVVPKKRQPLPPPMAISPLATPPLTQALKAKRNKKQAYKATHPPVVTDKTKKNSGKKNSGKNETGKTRKRWTADDHAKMKDACEKNLWGPGEMNGIMPAIPGTPNLAKAVETLAAQGIKIGRQALSQKWKDVLDPNINKEDFSVEEKSEITKMHADGEKPADIARALSKKRGRIRTSNKVRHFFTYLPGGSRYKDDWSDEGTRPRKQGRKR